MQTKKKVLMLCTGGTIAMLHKGGDPKKPLTPAKWKEIEAHSPALKELNFDVETQEMELIDSSDMHPGYWADIARKIRDEYAKFDGFVILHGTDTMSHTASALSFMLENLDKPVIVTGSQLPLAKPRNDAAQNLVTALTLAASDGVPTVPEVCVLFNNKLLRGNRSRKVSSNGFAGFDTPNLRPLSEIGEHITLDTKLIKKPASEGFFISEFLDPNVLIFDIFPGISPQILRSVFSIEGLKGVILRTYGTGNAPTSDALMKEIERAIERQNIAVVNVTQCNQGMVEMGLYDASVKLSRAGVISGVDMTPEAALVKMMFLLGQGYDRETVKELMQKDLRGEQSVNVFNFIYELNETKESVCSLKNKTVAAGFVKDKIKKASIRLGGVKITSGESPNLAFFMNYPSVTKDTPTDIAQCLGVINSVSDETDFILECTQKVKQVIIPGRPVQLTVVAQNGDISWETIVFSIYTDAID
ncbi:MAG: asparaginase [Oscillospiraceae bacterium]|nr:asparaginase [Oscillospiraceae bacterium]